MLISGDGRGSDSPPPGRYDFKSIIGNDGPKKSMGGRLP